MPHKADKSFFEKKRSWSEKKDEILSYYLEPYLAKVAKLRKPILLVDGFAGPGRFEDGKPGSPLIICEKAAATRATGANVRVLCVEMSEELFPLLKQNLAPFSFATALRGTFADQLPNIEQSARAATVFLYVDPFAVEGLDWGGLESVFGHVRQSGSSVEVLLNFNAASFVRRALSALKEEVPVLDPAVEDPEEIDARDVDSPSIERLNAAVGGDWWLKHVQTSKPFRDKVEAVATGLCEKLRGSFEEVGHTAILGRESHRVPKYYLVFGSRHPDGLVLMNEAMVKSRKVSAFSINMFTMHELRRAILAKTAIPIERGLLIKSVIKDAFGMFTWAEIRGVVEELLKDGSLRSSTGKVKINDDVKVYSSQQQGMFNG